MKKRLFLLQFLLWGIVSFHVQAQDDNASLQHLYTLAGKSINYSNHIPENLILQLCQNEEKKVRQRKNNSDLFVIQLITVNSYCLKGDIGLAVDKAQSMYSEAKELNSELGLALSAQAIANTYMHSNQFQQAYTAFEESYEKLSKQDSKFLTIRLLIQQIHVCMLMQDTTNMQRYLVEARKLLDRAEFPDKKNYIFSLQCYQTLYYIVLKDEELARINLSDARSLNPKENIFSHLYYQLCTRYHDLMGEYEQALAYCDSTWSIAERSENRNECKDILKEKASLLAKNGQKEQACDIYDSARTVSNALNMERYSKQIDTLRVSYWVDQMAVENADAHNRFLMWITLAATLLLACAAFLMHIGRKKNQQLILSRQKLKAARQETKDSIQSKNLFLSNMSHELRTPLNAIVGFSDLLTTDYVDDPEAKLQMGERIEQNASLLLKLFNDVADLSALKNKKINFEYSTCEAVALCRNVIDTVESVKQTAAKLYFSTSLQTLPLYTDPGRLQQVLINLLINATKFTSKGSITLVLQADEGNNEATFSIEDTGCGIPLAKQPYIFERFEKLHEGIQGAGLGLSICQLIVEHIGGNIWIDSSYTQGARFMFTHPLNKQH